MDNIKTIIVEPGSAPMTIWRMRIAGRVPKATNTHSANLILIAFPLQQCLNEGASELRYMYMVCLFFFVGEMCCFPNTDVKWHCF